MRCITHHSPAVILATGAVVLSLGGTAFALPGANSVDRNDIRTAAVNSSDIRNSAVRTPDLAFGSVTNGKIGDGAVNSLKLLDNSVASADIEDDAVESRDVRNDSLTGQDIQDASLTGADVQDDALTGQDVAESTLQGVMPAQTRFVISDSPELPGTGGGTPRTQTATCPAGERAIGGGGAWLIPTLNGGNDPTALDRAFLSASMPTPAQPGTDAATGWQVAGRNVTGTNRILRAYAICVPNQIP